MLSSIFHVVQSQCLGQSYNTTASDTCDAIAAAYGTSTNLVSALNPNLNCTSGALLGAGQQVCLGALPPIEH